MEYLELFNQLYHHKVRYLICGGLAVNIYGIPRMTADIDLLLDFTVENIAQFDAAINLLKYKPVLPIKLETLVSEIERQKIINEKNLVAFSYYNSFSNAMSLDVLIDVPLKFSDMWSNKETRKADGIEVNLVSIDDLIKLKQYANRKQDNDDILLLSKLIKK